MRALLHRFRTCERGGAATTYLAFTGLWFLIVAAGVHFTTPMMTTKLQAVSSALQGHLGPLR